MCQLFPSSNYGFINYIEAKSENLHESFSDPNMACRRKEGYGLSTHAGWTGHP